MVISSRIQAASVKIFANDVLHIHYVREKFIGLQAWQYETEGMFYVEITCEGGVITCDYNRRDMWLAVLAELAKVR